MAATASKSAGVAVRINIQFPPSVLHHDLDDLFVGLAHPLAAQLADVADGVLNALGDDAVPGTELLAVQVHMVAHDAGLDAGSDLGGAAGLGAVADDARDDEIGRA